MAAAIRLKARKGKEVAKPDEPTAREAETLARYNKRKGSQPLGQDPCCPNGSIEAIPQQGRTAGLRRARHGQRRRQAIVGPVTHGGGPGKAKKMGINPMHSAHSAPRCAAKSKRSGEPCQSTGHQG